MTLAFMEIIYRLLNHNQQETWEFIEASISLIISPKSKEFYELISHSRNLNHKNEGSIMYIRKINHVS